MTSQPGKETIAIQIFPSISRSKAIMSRQTFKYLENKKSL